MEKRAIDDVKVVWFNEKGDEMWPQDRTTPVYIDEDWYDIVVIPTTSQECTWEQFKQQADSDGNTCVSLTSTRLLFGLLQMKRGLNEPRAPFTDLDS